jgi:phosphoribosylformylglycinamidine cyclo-ligase
MPARCRKRPRHPPEVGAGEPPRAAPWPATYKGAGVDIAAGDEVVARIRQVVGGAARPEVMGGIGGFGGLFAFDPARYRQPVLVASTDGVGTKAAVASATGRYDTLGIDLVAMCADDVACTGAQPLFLLDYVSVSTLEPARIESLVAGIAEGCRRAGCALLGGETAEHGDTVAPGHVDLAGFCVGVAERDHLLGPERVRAGDSLVGLASPGLRSNGYSLARHVLLERAGLALDAPAWPGAGASLADELLRPSVIYAPALVALRGALPDGALRAAAHITGGGIPGNLSRVLPDRLHAVVERGRWEEPRIFDEIRRLGPVEEDEMGAVFNLGLGMVVVVEPDAAAAASAVLAAHGVRAMEVGRVVEGAGGVELVAP